MKTLEEKYNELEKEVNITYYKLIKCIDKTIEIQDYENNTFLILDEVNGGSTEFYLKAFTEDHYLLGENVASGNMEKYRFSDIASLFDQVIITEILQKIILEKFRNIIEL